MGISTLAGGVLHEKTSAKNIISNQHWYFKKSNSRNNNNNHNIDDKSYKNNMFGSWARNLGGFCAGLERWNFIYDSLSPLLSEAKVKFGCF